MTNNVINIHYNYDKQKDDKMMTSNFMKKSDFSEELEEKANQQPDLKFLKKNINNTQYGS